MRDQNNVFIFSAVLHLHAKHLHLYAAGIADTKRGVAMVKAEALGKIQSVPMVEVGDPAGEAAFIYWLG